jgi:purine-binding chemotaxis protein CheW
MIPMTESHTQGAADRRELISFRAGEQEYGIDIMAVREIRGWSAATTLPHAPPFIRGVINLRGAVLPIMDFSARLGLAATEPSARHVIIVVDVEGKTVGLLVDAVSDILSIADEMLQPTPDIACDRVRSLVKGLISLDARMIGEVALERLLPEREILAQ